MLEILVGLLRDAFPRAFAGRQRVKAPQRVLISGNVLHIRDGDGTKTEIALDQIAEIGIVTTDDGPWFDDLFWCFTGRDGTPLGTFSDEADGAPEAVSALSEWAGFDHGAMIAAMGSTDNAAFTVWRRPADVSTA